MTAEPTPRDCLRGHAPLETALSGLRDNRFGAPGAYDIARCPECGLLQTVPRLDPGALDATYRRYYNFGPGAGGAYAALRGRLYASPLYRLWLAVDGDVAFFRVEGAGRLIDIGCNEGRGLEQYRRNGFDAEGLEPNAPAAARARARGFKVSPGPLAAFRAEAPFDVAVLANVLEHSLDPDAMLGHVARLLKPGGEAWISLPNADSAFRRLFGRDWINWHVPYHVTHFSGATLRRTLADAGFEVFAFRNVTPALWVAQSLIARIYSVPGKPTRRLRAPSILGPLMLLIRGLLFPTLWLMNAAGRGDALVLRARKL